MGPSLGSEAIKSTMIAFNSFYFSNNLYDNILSTAGIGASIALLLNLIILLVC